MTTRLVYLAVVSLAVLALQTGSVTAAEQRATALAELLNQFDNARVFWQQAEIAEQLVALGDTRALAKLAHWLSDEDRHVRGNAAFVFAGFGDERGMQVISAILTDFSNRPVGQGIARTGGDGRFVLARQIEEDRYYAVHLLGALKNPRAVPVLTPLLADDSVNYKVAWALGEIGGPAAVDVLIGALNDKSPDVRVIAILSLEKLRARKALSRLRALVADQDRSHFGDQVSVSEAARAAIATMTSP